MPVRAPPGGERRDFFQFTKPRARPLQRLRRPTGATHEFTVRLHDDGEGEVLGVTQDSHPYDRRLIRRRFQLVGIRLFTPQYAPLESDQFDRDERDIGFAVPKVSQGVN